MSSSDNDPKGTGERSAPEGKSQRDVMKIMEHPAASGALALAGSVPGLGVLTDFFIARVSARREQAQREFLTRVVERIEALEQERPNTIDHEHIWKGDFGEVLAVASEEVAREGDSARIEYLCRFVSEYSRHQRPDVTLKGVFWRIMLDLGGTHCVILDRLWQKQRPMAQTDLDRAGVDRSELVSFNELRDILEVEQSLMEALITKLVFDGLVREVGQPSAGDDRSERFALRPLGRGFIEFVNGEWKDRD